MEEVSFKNGTGVYSVTLPEKTKFDAAAVKKAVGNFTLDRVDLKIAGEVARDDKGLWLTAPSGTKLLLANRPKKDDKDQPPDATTRNTTWPAGDFRNIYFGGGNLENTLERVEKLRPVVPAGITLPLPKP